MSAPLPTVALRAENEVVVARPRLADALRRAGSPGQAVAGPAGS